MNTSPTSASLCTARCAPCEGGVPPLDADAIAAHMPAVPQWTTDGTSIERACVFPDFRAALAYVNRIGELAEFHGHHPDLLIHGWNRVKIRLSTHAIGGLSVNDFILAAHIDQLDTPAAP